MRRAARLSGCAKCGAGAGCSAIKYQSLQGAGVGITQTCSGFRVWDLGFRVWELKFRVVDEGCGLRTFRLGLRVKDKGCGV